MFFTKTNSAVIWVQGEFHPKDSSQRSRKANERGVTDVVSIHGSREGRELVDRPNGGRGPV